MSRVVPELALLSSSPSSIAGFIYPDGKKTFYRNQMSQSVFLSNKAQ